MYLSDLLRHQSALVTEVLASGTSQTLSQRLQDIGFVPGEPVTVVATAPWGGDPILVQVGGSRFALRRSEARLVRVEIALGESRQALRGNS